MTYIKRQGIYNAYDSVCRVIRKTSNTYEGAMGVILCVCVGEKKEEEKKGKDREEKIYAYIYKLFVFLILVRRAQRQEDRFV
jgi:hypothetical protein